MIVYGKSIDTWQHDYPLMSSLLATVPVCWRNPDLVPFSEALSDISLTATDVSEASARLQRFAPFWLNSSLKWPPPGGSLNRNYRKFLHFLQHWQSVIHCPGSRVYG